MPTLKQNGFELGQWRVEPRLGRLSSAGSGQIQRLEPRVMDLLVFLAEHPGQVCSKHQLLDQVWPDVAVQEVALARAVSNLRRHLGDDPKSPSFIETLPKRGYRLIVEPRPLTEPVESSQPSRSSSRPQSKPSSRSDAIRIWVLTWIIVLVPWLAWKLEPRPDRPTIMVLPLRALTTDPEVGYLAEGLSQDIRDRLAQRPGMRVISETTSRSYSDHPEPRLRGTAVHRLLGGTLQPQDSQLVVQLWLVDNQSDEQVWSTEHRLSRDHLLPFQEQILREIAGVLDASLQVEAEGDEALSGAAFDTYLRARGRYRRYSAADNKVACELFEVALALVDERKPAARARVLAGLANALALETANYGAGPEPARQAEPLARQAILLNPQLAEAQKALGTALQALGRRNQALAAYQESLRLRPGYDEAVHNRSFLDPQLGEWDEAGRWQRGAQKNPNRPLR